MDVLVASDMRLEDLPIVYAGLARRSGVGDNEAPLNLFRRDWQGFAVDSVGLKMDGADATVERGIVILAASRYADELCFDVLRNDADLFAVEGMSGVGCERRGGCDHQRRRA